jgi:hypothetical protein
MSDKNEKKEFAKGTYVPKESPADPCKETCDEILHRLNGEGIPITINQTRVREDSSSPEIIQISKFINSSRIIFREYKKLMDEILDCNLGKLVKTDIYDSREQKKAITGPASTGGMPTPDCGDENKTPGGNLLSENEKNLFRTGSLFSSSKSYTILKYATEKFINKFLGLDDAGIPPDLVPLPYIKLIEDKLSDICCCECPVKFRPLFIELIWNYWHEEGMMVHTINAIASRFQNKRTSSGKDPLANLVLDPLRPLNNLVWGYIQDRVHRLTPTRREFEYDHQYGIALFAGNGSRLNSAESNSFFIQAFHNLLYKCSVFYKEADNLFRVPDAFPILNALREVHLLLSEAAGNQFSDLTMTSRSEMMLEQYILSRSEIREFLGGRIMVPYDEPWMDKVDTMKALMGWPGASISYYHDLAENGEKILLSIRWISWSAIDTRDLAKDWALLFRDSIQRYIHCYQAVTGVDLSATEIAGRADEKAIMPAFLIQRNLLRRDKMVRRR